MFHCFKFHFWKKIDFRSAPKNEKKRKEMNLALVHQLIWLKSIQVNAHGIFILEKVIIVGHAFIMVNVLFFVQFPINIIRPRPTFEFYYFMQFVDSIKFTIEWWKWRSLRLKSFLQRFQLKLIDWKCRWVRLSLQTKFEYCSRWTNLHLNIYIQFRMNIVKATESAETLS